MKAAGVIWPPRDEREKELVISFVLDELDLGDVEEPVATGTSLLVRLMEAWERRRLVPSPPEEQDRGRGRPKIDKMDRLPDIREFIAIDAERVRSILREHWGHSNFTKRYIPTVAEIVVRRWGDTARDHGLELTTELVARLSKRNKKRQRRLA